MKKLLCVVLALCLCLLATAAMADGLKVGVILVGDETEGYTLAHMNGIREAIANVGLTEDSIVWRYKVPEDASTLEAAEDLAEQGCNLIISNSYSHEDYMDQAAEEYPEITFVAMTGDYAAISGKSNFKNAFTWVFQSRYVSGVVAGMKLNELVETGTLTAETQPNSFDADGNIKIGYVGAFPYAEVVSGYTAFYLGVKSVCPNVVMEVQYTNSWFNVAAEAASAEALVANGCVIIGQHADSTGAPSAIEKLLNNGTICYSVGYNIDMLDVAPNAALTSPTNEWGVYYTYLFSAMLNGEEVAADWAAGYDQGAVAITALGTSCAAGTAEKVAEVEAALADGSLQVFDTTTFTVNGEPLTTCPVDLSYMDYSTMTAIYQGETVECVVDGAFRESVFRAAPYFSVRIDGITEDAQ